MTHKSILSTSSSTGGNSTHDDFVVGPMGGIKPGWLENPGNISLIFPGIKGLTQSATWLPATC